MNQLCPGVVNTLLTAPTLLTTLVTLRAPMPSFDDITSDFELLDDWEDRYRYVIELGRQLAPLPSGAKTDASKIFTDYRIFALVLLPMGAIVYWRVRRAARRSHLS